MIYIYIRFIYHIYNYWHLHAQHENEPKHKKFQHGKLSYAPESQEQSNEKLINFRSLQVGYNQYLLKES
jgi:hypothetical protein